ncbi:MAG TPA: helix-turn-helix domain-containing protein [Ilumatobacteraceae bacterium]|nr:helix-turn-helix domain-containing protein [Ilumatobacteraceae bacterium]
MKPGRGRESRAARYAALGDPIRLAIVDELVGSDRSLFELGRLTGVGSNLLAHHLDVLEAVGLITRSRSSGDRRRRYVHLRRGALAAMATGRRIAPQPVLFVCTHNSARSQLASALWGRLTAQPAASAGTHPAARVHPGAVAAARRAGLDLSGSRTRLLDETMIGDRLVVTVCDRAHEELDPGPSWLHWSVADPVAAPSRAAFDVTVADLSERIVSLVEATP